MTTTPTDSAITAEAVDAALTLIRRADGDRDENNHSNLTCEQTLALSDLIKSITAECDRLKEENDELREYMSVKAYRAVEAKRFAAEARAAGLEAALTVLSDSFMHTWADMDDTRHDVIRNVERIARAALTPPQREASGGKEEGQK